MRFLFALAIFALPVALYSSNSAAGEENCDQERVMNFLESQKCDDYKKAKADFQKIIEDCEECPGTEEEEKWLSIFFSKETCDKDALHEALEKIKMVQECIDQENQEAIIEE